MKQKNNLRSIACLLALLTVGAFAASCGSDAAEPSHVNTDTDIAADTVSSDTASDDYPLPGDLNYNGRTFTVYIDRNFEVMKGPEEQTGIVLDDAVYNRNIAVEERLNCELKYYEQTSYDTGMIVKDIVTQYVMAGDSSIDVFTGYQVDMTKMHNSGYFINCYDLDHVDFSKPWWNDSYMSMIQVDPNVRTFLIGDYFLSALMSTSTLYCNNTLYGKLYEDSEGLYDMVLDGTWTLDKLSQITKDTYIDLNNNGKTDIDDQLGYATYLAYASVDPFIYLSAIQYTSRDSDGYPVLNLYDERWVDLTAKVVDFFYQTGSIFKTKDENESTTAFKEGRVMFLGFQMLSNAEKFRDMEDDFGFLPYPKYDESQTDYHSLVRAAACPGAIPVTSKNIDMAGAVLEALNYESCKTVIPAYYESTLKEKYSRDGVSTKMIDIIYRSAYTDFVFAFDSSLNSIGTVMRDLVQKKSTDYVSMVAKKENAVVKSFDDIVSSYQE